jgi:acetylornithine deacetylase
LRERIEQWIDAHEQEAIHFLQKLVQEPSIQGNEASVQKQVADKLYHLELEVDVWSPEGEEFLGHPYFCSTKIEYSNRPNVVGVWKGTGGGRSIILNGHVDVVPAGDLKQWEDDPYSGKVIDGKLYGRGSTDMKGGNVSLLLAIECLKDLGIKLKGDVIFESVIEEESGGAGTLASIIRGYKADAAIIPEPTNMKIFPSQQGSMWFRIIVNGKSAHGGTRYEGVNAIEKAQLVLQTIQQLEKERNDKVTDPLYKDIPIPLPINVGSIQGGEWPSSVPDQVTIEGRIGVGPEETLEEVREQLENAVQSINDEWLRGHHPLIEWFGAQWLPGKIDLDHPLINILSDQYSNVYGVAPTIEASPWGTDGGLLIQVGETPSIVFGPGVTRLAHYSNEYIEISKVLDCAKILALTIYDWCGGELS